MDLLSKDDFNYFMRRALTSTNDDCYIELYNLLLRSFVAADVDFDGKVSVEEFDGMIEAAAALPRKFGYEWWDEAGCTDEAARKQVRGDLFKQIDENNDGGISFDEWLAFALKRYTGFSDNLPKSLDDEDKDVFVAVCKKFTDNLSAEYRRLYWFHWKCFQAADADRDGKVSEDEFNKMIDMATAAQKRFGMEVGFQTEEERKEMFKKMDENGDGGISFDEWLTFSLQHIIAKVASL
jgi:Ca2+-binding EF-hand superfamily protein